MNAKIEKFSLILIFIFLVTLNYFQANSQSFGYIQDMDWTILYNPLLLSSNIEQSYIDHPAYTIFFIFSVCLKVINFFSQDLNINVLSILDSSNPKENFQNIFVPLFFALTLQIHLRIFGLFPKILLLLQSFPS